MTDRKRIVIVGDSYSDSQGIYFKYKPTHTWVGCLSDSHEVECYAKEGASNLDILQQVPDDTSWDWIICSLAPIVRQGKQQFKDSRQLFEENKKAAFKLTRLPQSLVWSPFEDYKNLSQVHYMPWIEHNEFWIQYHYADRYFSREFEFTGCHFTREGNDLHFEWVCDQLNLRR